MSCEFKADRRNAHRYKQVIPSVRMCQALIIGGTYLARTAKKNTLPIARHTGQKHQPAPHPYIRLEFLVVNTVREHVDANVSA